MIVVMKKKKLIFVIVVLIILAICLGTTLTVADTFSPQKEIVVVLDAGHGGRDNGVIGTESGIKEKELNLKITFLVKEYLEKGNVKVVLTRKNDNGLYGDANSNFKQIDMNIRKDIIRQAQPNVVVSIHANKFPDSSRRGAQAFYEEMSEESQKLAKALQASINTLNNQYVEREFTALKGNYFILKCSRYPSAIIETGFLSNSEDDKLLNDKEYQEKMAFQIYSGIMSYITESVEMTEPIIQNVKY